MRTLKKLNYYTPASSNELGQKLDILTSPLYRKKRDTQTVSSQPALKLHVMSLGFTELMLFLHRPLFNKSVDGPARLYSSASPERHVTVKGDYTITEGDLPVNYNLLESKFDSQSVEASCDQMTTRIMRNIITGAMITNETDRRRVQSYYTFEQNYKCQFSQFNCES